MVTERGKSLESASGDTLSEGSDYYIENGLYVFTAEYLLKRGYCCQSGCRHCPYGFSNSERRTGKQDEPPD